jgi:ATP-dependent helicase HrpB
MLVADLSALVLSLAKWGARDPAGLAWLDPPPIASVQAAQARLVALGAIDADGAITRFGERVASLPMDPAQAAMVLFGAEVGQASNASRLALLLQERGLGGRGEDLLHRLTRWNGDSSRRAEAARKLAQRWAERAKKLVGGGRGEGINPALLLARAMPDNVAKARDSSGESWLSAGGRGYVLDPASSFARAEWIVIGDAQGTAKGAHITAAAALSGEEVEKALAQRIERRSVLGWNAADTRVEARLERRLGAITMASGPDPQPDSEAVECLLLEKARERLIELLPASLLARARHAGIDSLALDRLEEEAQDWLSPLLTGRRDLHLSKRDIADALMARFDWDARQRLELLAPREFISPAATTHAIDYADEAGPSVELRVQALFGLDRHPMIGEPPQPVLLKLTSPAGRPIQSTRDLSGFWRGSWRDVQREMKGRYPKHRWPDEPWVEKPSLKTKNAFSRGKS